MNLAHPKWWKLEKVHFLKYYIPHTRIHFPKKLDLFLLKTIHNTYSELIRDCLVLYEFGSPEMVKARKSSLFEILHSSQENSFPKKARLICIKNNPQYIFKVDTRLSRPLWIWFSRNGESSKKFIFLNTTFLIGEFISQKSSTYFY
jgi:hypothetical protein